MFSRIALAAGIAFVGTAFSAPDASALDRLFNRNKGQIAGCYKKVSIPATYQTVTKRVMVSPARTEARTVPAVYGQESKRVMVSPGGYTTETIPAVFKIQPRRVMIQNATTTYRTIPAVYKHVREKRVVAPSYVEWKRQGLFRRKMAQVLVPEETAHVTRKVLVRPARHVPIHHPAVYSTVHERVLVTPSSSRRVYQQPVYQNVMQQVVVTPARTEHVNIPAQYENRTERVMMTPGTKDWALTSGGRTGSSSGLRSRLFGC